MSSRRTRTAGPAARWPRVRCRRCAAAAVALVMMLLAGCSSPPAAPHGSVAACSQFGVGAIRRHVTVTAVPDACRGLSQVEVNTAVSLALRIAAAGARGKVGQRELIARDSPYLAGLIRTAPASGPPAVAAPLTGQPGRTAPSQAALSLAALAAWLVTVGLGVSMMARWITRTRRRGAQPGRGRGRGPTLNFTHFGLALTGLLTWICYLVTDVTGLAWAACGLLILVAALGMTLVFPALATVARPADDRPAGTGTRGPPVLVVAAHIAAACLTLLLVMLAAAGSG